MDQEKIGKFIKKLREDNKLTQEELGEKLNVSDKAVSKWERGINLPDISNLQILADIFKVSITEILIAEKNPNREKSNKIFVNWLKSTNKIIQKRYLHYLLAVILIFISLISLLFMFNDYDKNSVYKIRSANGDYNIRGYFITNQGMNIFMIENITYQGELIGTSNEPFIDQISIKFLVNNNVLFLNKFEKEEKHYYSDFLDLLKFTKLDENKNQIKNNNNYYYYKLIIEYPFNNSTKKEEIKLNVEQIYSNDKIFY